jgi:hypothetical protein
MIIFVMVSYSDNKDYTQCLGVYLLSIDFVENANFCYKPI